VQVTFHFRLKILGPSDRQGLVNFNLAELGCIIDQRAQQHAGDATISGKVNVLSGIDLPDSIGSINGMSLEVIFPVHSDPGLLHRQNLADDGQGPIDGRLVDDQRWREADNMGVGFLCQDPILLHGLAETAGAPGFGL
jgi:hypothetical protein